MLHHNLDNITEIKFLASGRKLPPLSKNKKAALSVTTKAYCIPSQFTGCSCIAVPDVNAGCYRQFQIPTESIEEMMNGKFPKAGTIIKNKDKVQNIIQPAKGGLQGQKQDNTETSFKQEEHEDADQHSDADSDYNEEFKGSSQRQFKAFVSESEISYQRVDASSDDEEELDASPRHRGVLPAILAGGIGAVGGKLIEATVDSLSDLPVPFWMVTASVGVMLALCYRHCCQESNVSLSRSRYGTFGRRQQSGEHDVPHVSVEVEYQEGGSRLLKVVHK